MTEVTAEYYPVGDKHTLLFDAALSSTIAALHLSVRRWQVATDNNVFSNLYESQVDLGDIAGYYLAPGGNFFAAQDPATQAVVGIVGIRNDGDGVGTVKRFATNPDFQHRGIGSAVIRTAVDWARDNDFIKLELQTGKKEKARPLYERVGFICLGETGRNNKDWAMELVFKS